MLIVQTVFIQRSVVLAYRTTFRGFAFGLEIEAQKLIQLLKFN